MRSLITSIVSLVLVIVIWSFFYNYSVKTLDSIIDTSENEIITLMKANQWDAAYDSLDNLYEAWNAYRNKALFFNDTSEINSIDFAFSKALMYVKAKDLSNGSGELFALEKQIKCLYENEKLSLENIF